MAKILGKYEIIEAREENEFLTQIEHKHFYIIKKSKEKTSQNTESLQDSMFSHHSQKLNAITHPNISRLKVDEDEEAFYFIAEKHQETRELDSEIFRICDEVNYEKLLRCYIQILDAIECIHQNGLYHGNINPSNILIDDENQVFVLDFGRSYFFPLLEKGQS